jgi:aminopeptidase N
MENWGLITYRETALFATDDSSASEKQRVAYVVAHELAHQWFGNLVTMEWWSDLWLNEGFATWAGWLAIDKIFPHWDVWTNFTNDDAGYAMKTDALASSHAIQVTIGDPSEIDEVFDALSYNKGASMIRMVEAHVGSDVFRMGLRNYIERHQYSNTLTADLWTAISECAGYDVADIMDSWCLKVGFPVVTVEGRNDNFLQLSQSRFFSGGEESKEDHLWSIPLHGSNEKSEITSTLFNTKSCNFKCSGEYVKLNAGQTSFVRVNYDKKGWEALQAPISSLSLPAVDRLGVIMDAFALAKAGKMSTAVALDLCKAYKNEDCYPVWSALASGLSEVTDICSNSSFFTKYESFCGDIFSTLMGKLGWNSGPNDSDLTKKLRALCLGAAAKYGDKAVVSEALSRFKIYANGGDLEADLRGVVFSTAVKFGGEDEFNKMIEIFEKVESPQLKMKALTSCGLTQDPKLVQKYLDYAFSGKVRSNNVLYVLATLGSNPSARHIAWEYVKANWKSKITPMFDGQHSLYAYCVVLPIRGFVTEEKAKEAEEFFKENPVPSAKMKLSQTLENMRTKIAWLQRDNAALMAYFS